jgi:hypothetical protein
LPPITHKCFSSPPPIHATCSAHHIIPDMIILIAPGEDIELWNSTLCSFIQPPVTSSLLGPSYSPQHLSHTPSDSVPPLRSETTFHTQTDPQGKS